MESSVVSSLPDHAFTPTPRKHGVEQTTMKHSSETGVESTLMWVILLSGSISSKGSLSETILVRKYEIFKSAS